MKSYKALVFFFVFISCNSQNKLSENQVGQTNSDLQKSISLNQKYVLDTTIVKSIDLSGRLENEIIKYYLKVKDWEKTSKLDFLFIIRRRHSSAKIFK